MPVPDSGTHAASSDDGVRFVVLPQPRRRGWLWLQILALLSLGLGLFHLLSVPRPSTPTAAVPAGAVTEVRTPVAGDDRQLEIAAEVQTPKSQVRLPASTSPVVATPADPNDLATYVRPGDPEPTVAELIDALHQVGEHGGIAAFNPPGTSPPLPGLAVPDDYLLPPGYVRHHQVTDQGEPIPPILMFAPGHVLRDANGAVIPLPENLVVPPELAPPGLPIRQVEIPPQ